MTTTDYPDTVGVLLRATRDFAALAERSAEDAGLTLAQMRLLLTLHETGVSNCSALAARLRVSVSSVTRLVARPQMVALVARRHSPANASVVELTLTADGHATVDRVTAARAALFGVALAGMSQARRTALAQGLGAVCDHIAQGAADE
ncbi:MarR family transcriptional regulator [Tsukamurella sp. 8F]|uniref:MarR family winged helix-turn-helix transcriptional regulator n=1 Tax=unclassified Tsukamurella TaxID=2633480 RepID=UPI0023BA0D94|nr:MULTISPECIES: MarR family transcriptional regulator [unclassified Tsukamurella]MDF0528615.1 MarR family transcriptional regulator [Tsukamurella sp. 8J]MDF0585577.1 MarR family transcriptional regulator [Tsukamurella sp. 8F]